MPVLEQVLERYPKKVKIVFKNYPLKSHSFAQAAATAAHAAAGQGKFWEFHDLLFKNYKQLNSRKIQEIAEQLKLDLARFEKDRKDPRIQTLIRRDLADAARADVRSTPSVFINGRLLRNRNLAGFRKVIEKELKQRAQTRP